jgi:hypothetical protein
MSFLTYKHIFFKNRILNEAKERVQKLTHSAAASIDTMLQQVITATETVADDLSSGKLPRDEQVLKRRITDVLGRNPQLMSMAIAFEPYTYRSSRRLFSPYYKKVGDTLFYQLLDEKYDYTLHDWYKLPLKEGKNLWMEPFFAIMGGTLLTSYSAIFYEHDAAHLKVPAGVVIVGISLDGLKNNLEALDLGPSGFPALVSAKGVYLYHPDNEYVVGQKTITDVARERGDKDRLWLGERINKGVIEGGIIDHVSLTTGLSSWLAYEPVPAAGWTLQNTFLKNDVPLDFDTLRRQLIWITCLAMVFLVSLSFLVIDVQERDSRKLILASIVVWGILVAGIGIVWYLALSYETLRKDKGVAVLDRATLGKVREEYADRSKKHHTDPPIYLPTGVVLDSIRLVGDNDALVTGVIWQKYDQTAPKDLSRAISLPSAEDVRITETSRLRSEGSEVFRWQFQARVTQHMGYSRYPLDREALTLQILHKDVNHNVVLVPDIPAYKLMNPVALPGLDRAVALPGWTIKKTFFDLAEKRYDVNFGISNSVLAENFPLLRFNIVVERNFIDAFISNLTPLIVVAFMLFLLLLTTTCDDATMAKARTGAGLSLSMGSALFLVVVFAHIGVRQRIQAHGIFYLEYFYFVIYAAILGVTVSSVLFTMAKHLSFVQYRNNLVSKILFWPCVLGSLFVITVAVFY